MNRITIVCGRWDDAGGKPSSVMKDLIKGIKASNIYDQVTVFNGGHIAKLTRGIPQSFHLDEADVILWFVDIKNNYKKRRNIKELYPKSILVTSKNNCDEVYSFQEIIAHALALKSNLVLEIFKEDDVYVGQLLDPLGNMWCTPTPHFGKLGKIIAKRTNYLRKITRKPTLWSPETLLRAPLYDGEVNEFYSIARQSAEEFHKLINPAEGVKRFLGNASFRCMGGFPSFKTTDGIIYVSRRNLDKRIIGPDGFVQVGYNQDKDITWYRGDHKPSVDTVIQVQIYRKFPSIRFMIHSHLYAELPGGQSLPATKKMVPCGGLEEVDEILNALHKYNETNVYKIDYNTGFAINLVGHGSLIAVTKPEDFRLCQYIKRPVPEILED